MSYLKKINESYKDVISSLVKKVCADKKLFKKNYQVLLKYSDYKFGYNFDKFITSISDLDDAIYLTRALCDAMRNPEDIKPLFNTESEKCYYIVNVYENDIHIFTNEDKWIEELRQICLSMEIWLECEHINRQELQVD